MPKGSPKAQTAATMRYQKKMGLIAKSYKIKKMLADDFALACKARGIGQAAAISELMQNFIEETKKMTPN